MKNDCSKLLLLYENLMNNFKNIIATYSKLIYLKAFRKKSQNNYLNFKSCNLIQNTK